MTSLLGEGKGASSDQRERYEWYGGLPLDDIYFRIHLVQKEKGILLPYS